MTDYMEYVKGGDILMAPSLDYKHLYVLKCGLCEEYYGEFELFLTHYLSHYDLESNEEDDLSQTGVMDEQQLYDDIIAEEGEDETEDAVNEDVATESEHMSDTDGEVTITSNKEELDHDDEKNYNSEHESLEIEELAVNESDMHSEYVELFDESPEEEISYEENFVKSRENVMAFIAAYRKHPHLWDFNHPVKYRKKTERDIAWNAIARELHKTRNIQILSNQVAAVIIYLRQKYREKKVNAEYSETPNNEIIPLWMFNQLSFLKPFVATEPIGILDAHLDLSPQQTIKILGILKRCPHLWDSNTIEYYCTNKRKESIAEMKSIIIAELDIDVDVSTLKKFLQSLQDYFVLQKRRHMGYAKDTKAKSKYYQQMIFLYDHLGPFQCSHCRRTLQSPLQYKVHISQHDGTMPLSCYLCNKEYKLVETYIFHIRRHMNDLNQECKECGKKFLRVSELSSHMRSHTGDKPYFCEVCGVSFRHRTGFSLHKKRHDRNYITYCSVCSKGFYSKSTLDIHMKTHKDERDFVCSTCGKAFKAKRTLRAHLATHENGRHECVLCGKTFKNRINLLQHKRKHGSNTDPQLKSELLSDTRTLIKEESVGDDENKVIIDETTSLEEFQQPLEESVLASESIDGHPENVESIAELQVEKKSIVEKKSNNEYVRMFMESKENVMALIEAYRSESHLWNFSLPVQYRKKSKRTMTWKKIAIDLEKIRNIQIKSNQVAACILNLRQKYRERKRNGEFVAKNSNQILPIWAFKQLHFLNAFVESKPIALLDIHQDLSPKQTIQILNIFKRCRHLWDTSTIEYHCTNKLNEAVIEMKNLITQEMDLEVEEDSLRNYLHCIREYVAADKRSKMGILRGVREKVKYHNHLIFLYDHVGPFQCSRCRRTMLSKLSLKAHESQHDGTVPFQCVKCNKEFKLVETYVQHIRRHMGDLNKECKECGKKFLRLFDLEEHMRRHTGDKPFCCEICGASFRHRTGFGMHMKRHEKKYISFCPHCSKGFYSKDSMNMHLKSHTNERDYVCPTCGKSFKTRKTLKSHVAIHENGNHVCTLCGKSFKNRINLWQHKRKHRLNSSAVIKPEFLSPFEKN